MTVGISSHP